MTHTTSGPPVFVRVLFSFFTNGKLATNKQGCHWVQICFVHELTVNPRKCTTRCGSRGGRLHCWEKTFTTLMIEIPSGSWIHDFKILLFVFKAIHGFAPLYLRELVSIKRSGNYNLRSSSDSLLLATPTYRSRVTLGDRSFQVAAPALWNVLPREIRSITDLGIFKRHLKTYLFREAFY